MHVSFLHPRYHVDPKSGLKRGMTDMYVHVVDMESNTIMDPDKVPQGHKVEFGAFFSGTLNTTTLSKMFRQMSIKLFVGKLKAFI